MYLRRLADWTSPFSCLHFLKICLQLSSLPVTYATTLRLPPSPFASQVLIATTCVGVRFWVVLFCITSGHICWHVTILNCLQNLKSPHTVYRFLSTVQTHLATLLVASLGAASQDWSMTRSVFYATSPAHFFLLVWSLFTTLRFLHQHC